MEETGRTRFTKGGKNLIILGVLSVVVALITTSISLAIYHDSGDIYLDRSRPGYLPEQSEIDPDDGGEVVEQYDFSQNGSLTTESLTEYLEKLNEEIKDIEVYEKPFDMEILSDEHFGIPPAE